MFFALSLLDAVIRDTYLQYADMYHIFNITHIFPSNDHDPR
jgi:hypothetical protein